MASKICKKVIGVDINAEFIEYCTNNSNFNEEFHCFDISNIDLWPKPFADGVWSSFCISYIRKPDEIIKEIYNRLPVGGWIGLLDISCFISGNFPKQHRLYESIHEFEIESTHSGLYDFDFGAKMKNILIKSGFEISHYNGDVDDCELNFDGPASNDVYCNWNARMDRMQGLKFKFQESYGEIRDALFANLKSDTHSKNSNVRFVVGIKTL